MGSPLSSRLCVELAARLGKVDDDLRRRELLAVRVGKATHALDVRAGTHLQAAEVGMGGVGLGGEGLRREKEAADAWQRAECAMRA